MLWVMRLLYDEERGLYCILKTKSWNKNDIIREAGFLSNALKTVILA